jgi:CBS domain-containing membrane protein
VAKVRYALEVDMITVKEIMTTELYTLQETDTLQEARRLMMEENIRHLPIMDKAGKLVGLVTQRDLLAASLSRVAHVQDDERQTFEASIPLKQIMTTNLLVVHEKMNLREAARLLQDHKYGCLPVVTRGKLKGIITDSDFVAVAINLLEQLELTEPVDGNPMFE